MRLIDADRYKKDMYTEWPEQLADVLAEQPAIDPIKAAGGCYCRECKNYVNAYGSGLMMCMRPICAEDYSETGYMYPLEIDTKKDDFCSYGELREVQDDG